MMEAVLGPMPEHIIQDASQTTAKYFTSRCGAPFPSQSAVIRVLGAVCHPPQRAAHAPPGAVQQRSQQHAHVRCLDTAGRPPPVSRSMQPAAHAPGMPW